MKKFNIDKLIIILIPILVFLFLIYTKTLFSGYHFIDDHKILEISNYLTEKGFLNTLSSYISDDFLIRFRPFYYIYYISQIYILGPNFLNLFIFSGLLASISFILLYKTFRNFNITYIQSLLILCISFIGNQSPIWWRVGTNEPIGIFFISLSLYFMSKTFLFPKDKINYFLYIIFLIFSSFCKESFVMLIPAIITLKILLDGFIKKIRIKNALLENKLLIIPFLIFIIELILIKFVIGTNKIGYAGLVSSNTELISGLIRILQSKESLYHYILITLTLLGTFFIDYLYTKFIKKKQRIFNETIIFIIAGLLIIVPNIFIHIKSGMFERYLIPTTFGFALIIITFLKNIETVLIKTISIVFVIIFVIYSLQIATINAKNFANDGINTQNFFNSIIENSDPESSILLIAEPVDNYELTYSVSTYLKYYNRSKIYGYSMENRVYQSDFENSLKTGWKSWFVNKELTDINQDPQIIVFLNNSLENEENFFVVNKDLKDDYELINSNNISSTKAIYIHK